MEDQAERRKLVVGLGNPTGRYARTRHNVGWMVLAALRDRWRIPGGRAAFGGQLYDARRSDAEGRMRPIVLFEPHTFMNCSGEAVQGVTAFYKADCRDLLVVTDDLALPVGALRARARGSAGGHKGLADVLRRLGTQEVPRLRIGIGAPPPHMDAVDYVLATFEDDEARDIAPAIERAADAVEDWIDQGIVYVMDKYNRKRAPDETSEGQIGLRDNENGSIK